MHIKVSYTTYVNTTILISHYCYYSNAMINATDLWIKHFLARSVMHSVSAVFQISADENDSLDLFKFKVVKIPETFVVAEIMRFSPNLTALFGG